MAKMLSTDNNRKEKNNTVYYCKTMIAGRCIEVESYSKRVLAFFKNYLSEFNKPDYVIRVSENEIIEEVKSQRIPAYVSQLNPTELENEYYGVEIMLLNEKIADYMLSQKVLLMHGAAIAVNGKGFIFTAPSGTGKTTHILNWVKMIPGTIVVNGDKPLIDIENNLVYGTPWSGKEGLNTNTYVKLAGIISLERGDHNAIKRISFKEMMPIYLKQCYIPNERQLLMQSYQLIGALKEVPCFKLTCNADEYSAIVAYNGLVGNK